MSWSLAWSRGGDLLVPALAFATGIIVTLEFIVIGLLPLLAADLAVSLERAGWLVAAFALSAGIIGPVLTLLSARWPPRHVLVPSLMILAVSSVVAALSPGFSLLLGMRVVQGAMLTLFISVASATAAAMADDGRAGRAIGQVNLGMVVATALVLPAGVALAESLGWRILFAGLGLLALLTSSVIWWLMPPSLAGQASASWRQARILRRPPFILHLALSTLLFTAMFVAYSYIAAFFEQVMGWSGRGIALGLLGFGLAGVAGNWVASRWVDRVPTLLTVAVTLILMLAMAGLSVLGRHLWLGAVLLGVWGGAHTAAFVACQVRVMFAGVDAPSFAASLNIAACNLGIAAGAVLGGWWIARFGVESVGWSAVAMGIVTLLVAVLLGTCEGSHSFAPHKLRSSKVVTAHAKTPLS